VTEKLSRVADYDEAEIGAAHQVGRDTRVAEGRFAMAKKEPPSSKSQNGPSRGPFTAQREEASMRGGRVAESRAYASLAGDLS
jgi:hypothetical protein